MAADQAFPSASNVFSFGNLIRRCCKTEGEVIVRGTVTKALGFQHYFIKGIEGEKPLLALSHQPGNRSCFG